MGGKTSDIYGRDPDGGSKEIGNKALRIMAGKGVVTECAKADGPDTSDSHDITENLGSAKP